MRLKEFRTSKPVEQNRNKHNCDLCELPNRLFLTATVCVCVLEREKVKYMHNSTQMRTSLCCTKTCSSCAVRVLHEQQ